jgi:hypothetical protein
MARELRRPPSPKAKSMQPLAIIVGCVAAAVGYGVLHDLVTADPTNPVCKRWDHATTCEK